jgi:NADH:ubiquinone oxidoreductase subunit 5 (subunit L)/multisubunit Na+/H+ antiporter MnhA subunit
LPLDYRGPVLFRAEEMEFDLNLLLDGYSFTYALVATFLTGLILFFSRTYIHREKGYKRFYNNLKFFYLGLMLVLLAGFPIIPTFIGEDLMLGHIHENQLPLRLLIVLNLILDGLVIFRIYSRVFLGPHMKGYHEVAYRSS